MVFLLFPGDLGLVGFSDVKVQGIYTNLNGSDRCSGNAAEGVVEARWAGEGPTGLINLSLRRVGGRAEYVTSRDPSSSHYIAGVPT